MTLKFNGFKAKINFHTILNFVLFQKYEMYENKYRTKICDFTVLEVSPVSLVVLAIRLALFFIVTHMRMRAKTHARSWWRLASAGHNSLGLVLIFWQNLIGHGDDV